MPVKRSFSLGSLLLLFALVATALTLLLTLRKNAQVVSRLQQYEQTFGPLETPDRERVLVTPLADGQRLMFPGGQPIPPHQVGRCRISVPFGYRAFLHLADTKLTGSAYPPDPTPVESVAMNAWSFGSEELLEYAVSMDPDNTPRVLVYSGKKLLIDYKPPDWPEDAPGMPAVPAFVEHLQEDAGSPQGYGPSQRIDLSLWKDEASQRALVLWLEPMLAGE